MLFVGQDQLGENYRSYSGIVGPTIFAAKQKFIAQFPCIRDIFRAPPSRLFSLRLKRLVSEYLLVFARKSFQQYGGNFARFCLEPQNEA